MDINTFLATIMNIPNTTEMGGAMAGITGTTGPADQAVQDLKRTAMTFGAEYRSNPNSAATLQLGAQIEGQLTNLLALSALPVEQYGKLMAAVTNLTKFVPKIH
jgi:hypothetical protein